MGPFSPQPVERSTANQPARGIETRPVDSPANPTPCSTANQPARGIETLLPVLFAHKSIKVPQPINPHEGLKQWVGVGIGPDAQVPQPINPHEGLKRGQPQPARRPRGPSSTANQPARGIETSCCGPSTLSWLRSTANQPARGTVSQIRDGSGAADWRLFFLGGAGSGWGKVRSGAEIGGRMAGWAGWPGQFALRRASAGQESPWSSPTPLLHG